MYLLLSILIVCIAHIIRTLRWELLIETYEKPNRKRLLSSLSMGYVINFFIPFKLGDLFRAFHAGKRMKNGRGFALATVIIERYLDVVVVGAIFGIICALGVNNGSSSEPNNFVYYFLIAILFVLVVLLAIILKKQVKSILKSLAGMFNQNLEERILRFFWAMIWGFKDIFWNLSKIKLICLTVIMWTLYLSSYWCFSSFLGAGDWKSVFFTLFEKDSLLYSQIALNTTFIWYGIYFIVPSIIVFTISQFIPSTNIDTDEEDCLNLLPHINGDERRIFLEKYFQGGEKNKEYIENYLKVNRDILVLRDYSAGSNATTILCTDGKDSFYRKYAMGADGEKLYAQYEWIKKYQGSIPLPQISQCERTEEFCYYDMPYNSNAIGLFEYAHSNPKDQAWNYIQMSLETLEKNLYTINAHQADVDTIRKYIDEKVLKNIKKIVSAKWIKELQKYKTIVVNGKKYRNLQYYLAYLSKEHLCDVFKNDMYSDIHGDLTIENIICVKNYNEKDDFYIIDPNTGNIHDSSNLDYAKLLQSLHGNYEFFMATEGVEVHKNSINFTFIKSDAYAYLWRRFDTYMTENFSLERVKSIYYHEVIHWLRLLPYKIEKNGKRVLLFYVGLLIVLDYVVKRFEEDDR